MILNHIKGRHSYYAFVGKDGSPFMTTLKEIALGQIYFDYGNVAVTVVTEDRRAIERLLPVTQGELERMRR